VIIAGGNDPVSDSGAESCGEEARLRTAEVFMSGIQTAITANLEERGQVSTYLSTFQMVTLKLVLAESGARNGLFRLEI
jgi:hypothetical protein